MFMFYTLELIENDLKFRFFNIIVTNIYDTHEMTSDSHNQHITVLD